MRNRSFVTLGALALLAAASAFGQQKLRVDIPFEFHVADAVLPAGQYDVDRNGHGMQNLLVLDCLACGSRAVSLTNQIGGNDVPNQGRLLFNKYGDTYFLSEVWVAGYAQGGVLNQSKGERELARATVSARTSRVITIARR
jgi:hypothetical protein